MLAWAGASLSSCQAQLMGTIEEIVHENALNYWALMCSNTAWQEVLFQCRKCSQEDMKTQFLIYFFPSENLVSVAKK